MILGVVFEKRLIEKYIEEHGTEPETGEELSTDDLLPLKSTRIARPRPPTLTSIPALLATFQNEWDDLALQVFGLEQQVARLQKELSNALYQNDAAIRVIARLTKERDEARASLSKVTVTGGGDANGDEMAIDSTEALPEDLAEKVDATHKQWVDPSPRAGPVLWLTLYVGSPRAGRSAQCPRTGPLPTTLRPSSPNPRPTCRFPRPPRSPCKATMPSWQA